MRILIADDDRDFGSLLAEALREREHDVTVASTGKEAWDVLQDDYYEVLITDWQMPQLDGMALTKMVRAKGGLHYTYIILLTGYGAEEHYLEGMHAGADDFLSKPIDEPQLAARLIVAERIVKLQNHMLRLEAFMSVCSYCKSVRDEADRWVSMDQYFARRTGVAMSHGVCPNCFEKKVKPDLERFGVRVEEEKP